MKHVERLRLAVPVGEAYEFVTNPVNDTKWYRGARAVHRVAGTDDTYVEELSTLGIRYRAKVVISDRNPPHSAVISSADSRIPFRAVYTFEVVDENTTLFTMDASVTVSGFFAVLGPLFRVMLRRKVGGNFARLGELLGT